MTPPLMPKYKCHKEVAALKIARIAPGPEGSLRIEPSDESFGPFYVEAQFVPLHEQGRPKPGWYFVVYENGFQSFSPADAFESGYTLQ